MKTRRLKVYYGHHANYLKHPVIRLAGKYLSKFDFKIGDTVELTLEQGRISIAKVIND